MKRDIDEVYKSDRIIFGHLFENFVATEVMNNLSSVNDVEISHFIKQYHLFVFLLGIPIYHCFHKPIQARYSYLPDALFSIIAE